MDEEFHKEMNQKTAGIERIKLSIYLCKKGKCAYFCFTVSLCVTGYNTQDCISNARFKLQNIFVDYDSHCQIVILTYKGVIGCPFFTS